MVKKSTFLVILFNLSAHGMLCESASDDVPEMGKPIFTEMEQVKRAQEEAKEKNKEERNCSSILCCLLEKYEHAHPIGKLTLN